MTGTERALAAPPWAAARASLRRRWSQLSARDRSLAMVIVAVLGAFLFWSVALQPALRTLRDAPAQRESLDTQLQQMRALASEAQQLRGAPAINAEQSAAALRAASERLGPKARLSLQGERAVLTLNGVGSGALREWLAEVRTGARARPVDAQLSRGAQGFNGSIVLALGATP
jgi:general secretion pathway protein M